MSDNLQGLPAVASATTLTPTPDLTPSDVERIKARATAKFVRLVDRAIDNVEKISQLITPELREVNEGRTGTVKTVKVDASPTALQANLAIIDRAMGKVMEKAEGPRITVPIQIVMGEGKTVDVQATAVQPVEIG